MRWLTPAQPSERQTPALPKSVLSNRHQAVLGTRRLEAAGIAYASGRHRPVPVHDDFGQASHRPVDEKK